jgi:hypothetical protein
MIALWQVQEDIKACQASLDALNARWLEVYYQLDDEMDKQ